MRGNVDILPKTSLVVGSKIVGDVVVVVYEVPKVNSLVWFCCVIFAATGSIGMIGVLFGFRKSNAVWDHGHVLVG